VNLITKEVATVSGIVFTIVFFAIFVVSERINERQHAEEIHTTTAMDQFRLNASELISAKTAEVRPDNTICLVRDHNTLGHLKKALEITHTGKKDLVVMTVHLMRGPDTGYQDIDHERLFGRYEQYLFSKVVALAEKAGKTVHLLVVPSSNIFQAIAMTAAQLHSADIIAGRSSVLTPEAQAKLVGEAWEGLPNKPQQRIRFHVIGPGDEIRDFYLGAHAPDLSDEEIDFIHKLWLDVSHEQGLDGVRHKHIVVAALVHLADELNSDHRQRILNFVRALKAGESLKTAVSSRRQRRRLARLRRRA
jgi:hypothetical protein